MASRLRTILACLAMSLALAACGPSEPDQRKAFIAFLQNDVLPRPGARVPNPSAEKQKTFGDYAGHYAVITRFHERINASVATPMQQALSNGVPRSLEEAIARRADIAAVRAGLTTMRTALDEAAAATEAERAALKQPDDLRAVYASAYDKLVVQPVTVFREIFPPADDAFAAILAMAELVEGNRQAIKLNGSQLEVTNPALRAKVQAALEGMASKQRSMTEAQQKMRRVLYGS
jgi:soluble cytochrome b562